MNILKLPKWAQELIQRQKDEKDRLARLLKQAEDKVVKQSEEVQALLNIMRNLRSDLFDKWNHGMPLKDLVEASKQP